jgi:hypothetical protein
MEEVCFVWYGSQAMAKVTCLAISESPADTMYAANVAAKCRLVNFGMKTVEAEFTLRNSCTISQATTKS